LARYTGYVQLNKSKIGSWLLSLVLLATPFVLWSQRHGLYDWWRLRGYDPPARVRQLAADTTMNNYGQKLFYVHRPQLEDREGFNEHCKGHEQSIVLGCYISRHGIYIFDVQDERLQGIHEVTAAHEMLHAAYDRLDGREKERVNEQLERFFRTLDDARIKAAIDSYRKKDPNVVTNELHSIIGTEVRDIPDELEDHYKKYFDDRLKVVGFSEQYEQAFTERKNRVAAYDEQLAQLKRRIDESQSELSRRAAALSAEKARLNALLAAERNEEYNAAVPGFNAQVRAYNELIAATEGLIAEYNRIVSARNAVALEEQALVEAIDSRLKRQAEE
jgi:hypothetical protein